ncbi:MAG: hypothetical protein FJW96_15850 [Actinobacteria bacterium]|nr:hypothetical protein [Actinomycetota bacterium]
MLVHPGRLGGPGDALAVHLVRDDLGMPGTSRSPSLLPMSRTMKRVVLLGGVAFGTLGVGLLAAGYGAAGVLLCVVAVASVAVALTVTWRLDDLDDAPPADRRMPRT